MLGEIHATLDNINTALEEQVAGQAATIAGLKRQIDSEKQYSRQLATALGAAHEQREGAQDGADGQARSPEERLSELLVSDKLIHEENGKVIAELHEANREKDETIARLQKALEAAERKNAEAERKLRSAQTQVQTLRRENQGAKAELSRQVATSECLIQQVEMQKETRDGLFKELDRSVAANERLSRASLGQQPSGGATSLPGGAFRSGPALKTLLEQTESAAAKDDLSNSFAKRLSVQSAADPSAGMAAAKVEFAPDRQRQGQRRASESHYFSANQSVAEEDAEVNRTLMVTLLEQQVRLLEDERDDLHRQKAQLLVEVDEFRQMADRMAVAIKDRDKEGRDDAFEQDEYIDELESQLDHLQQHVDAQDQYIAGQDEQIEELKAKLDGQASKARKIPLGEVRDASNLPAADEEESKASSKNKRQKIDPPQQPAVEVEQKENLMQQLIRRSSCIFGFAKPEPREAAVAATPINPKQGTYPSSIPEE